jgi:hypothetical protein
MELNYLWAGVKIVTVQAMEASAVLIFAPTVLPVARTKSLSPTASALRSAGFRKLTKCPLEMPQTGAAPLLDECGSL